jgi:hypothetical protein
MDFITGHIFRVCVPTQGDAAGTGGGAGGDRDESGDGGEFWQRNVHGRKSSGYRNYSNRCAASGPKTAGKSEPTAGATEVCEAFSTSLELNRATTRVIIESIVLTVILPNDRGTFLLTLDLASYGRLLVRRQQTERAD